jgi:hypothetical protein
LVGVGSVGPSSVDTIGSDSMTLPMPLSTLPLAELVIEKPLRVTGSLFLECFCGMFGITLAVMMQSVPCICPWDSMFGPNFDVLKSG